MQPRLYEVKKGKIGLCMVQDGQVFSQLLQWHRTVTNLWKTIWWRPKILWDHICHGLLVIESGGVKTNPIKGFTAIKCREIKSKELPKAFPLERYWAWDLINSICHSPTVTRQEPPKLRTHLTQLLELGFRSLPFPIWNPPKHIIEETCREPIWCIDHMSMQNMEF